MRNRFISLVEILARYCSWEGGIKGVNILPGEELQVDSWSIVNS